MQAAVIKSFQHAPHGEASSWKPFASDGARCVDAQRFRAGMANLGGACTIITAAHAGERAGLTATAVCSVSVEPPRVLACVNRSVRAHQVITASGYLGINVLAGSQEGLARRFAGMVQGVMGDDRFLDGDWADSTHGVPVLSGALVSFECRVIEESVSGTHSIFLCDVTDLSTTASAQSALMYFNRNFVSIDANQTSA